jgi:hypothetical protein
MRQILDEIKDLTFYDKKIQKVLDFEINTDNKNSTIKMLYVIDSQIYSTLKAHILNKLNIISMNDCIQEIISNIEN